MSCIACEEFAKRITNLFRDPEVKEKYEVLIGVKIFTDCFICDGCNERVLEMYAFKEKCIEIYNRMYPTVEEGHQTTILPTEKSEEREVGDGYFITEIFEETHPENQSYEIEEVDESQKDESGKSTDEIIRPDDLNDYEEIYLEFNDEDDIPEHSFDDKKFTNPPKIKNRKSYTAEQKLQIIAFAEENRNRLAARRFGINESTVRCFRKQKDMLLKMQPDKKTNRRGSPHWPKIEAELKQYVIEASKSSGSKIKMKDIRTKAIDLAEKHGVYNFGASNSFVFKFMQRHSFPIASPRPRKKI